MERRQMQIAQELQHHAADFFARLSNRMSLMTITRVDVSADLKSAVVFFSVFPDSKEEEALAFAKRQRNDFRIYIKRHSRLPNISNIDFAIDAGEKNRQRIDDLTRS